MLIIFSLGNWSHFSVSCRLCNFALYPELLEISLENIFFCFYFVLSNNKPNQGQKASSGSPLGGDPDGNLNFQDLVNTVLICYLHMTFRLV